jgi:predicted dehydrogenase
MHNWALVGTGRVSEQMAASINKSADAKLLAVFSPTKANREKFAAKYEVPNCYESLEEMLANPEVEIIYIASPNNMHEEHVRMAAAASKQILCEKPLANDLATAKRMIEYANAAGIKFGVGFQYRQHPAHKKIRELVRSGELGEVVFADSAVHLPPMPYPSWYSDQEIAGGGVLPMTGVHRLDLLRYVLSAEVTEVSAFVERRDPALPFEDTVTAMLKFDTGVSATVRFAMSVNGRSGWAVAKDTTSQWWSKKPSSIEFQSTTESKSATYVEPDLYQLQVEDFNNWVADKSEFACLALDGLKAIEVTLAIRESSLQNHPVKIVTTQQEEK